MERGSTSTCRAEVYCPHGGRVGWRGVSIHRDDVSSPHGGRGVILHEVEVYGTKGGREKCHPPQN